MATKPKKIWDNYEVIGEVRKSDRIKFVVAAATRDGFRYINIREFYMRQRDGEWKPGRDGITIPLRAPLNNGKEFIDPCVNMLEVIKNAAIAVTTMPLADDTKAVWMMPKEK